MKILITTIATIMAMSIAQAQNQNARQAKPDSASTYYRLDPDAPSGTGGIVDRATRSFEVQGADLWLGTNDGRSQGSKTKATNNPNRALVHADGDQLVINYGGDFEGGTVSNSKLIIEATTPNDNFVEIKQYVNGVKRATDGSQIYVQPGDDSYLTDLDMANGMGVCGRFNKEEGGLKLGNQGQYIYGKTGNLGINTTSPKQTLHVNGKTLIGNLQPGNHTNYQLAVDGKIVCKNWVTTQLSWADYVFKPGYRLPSLDSVKLYIDKYKHLPGVASEREVLEKGLDGGEMMKAQMEKIEELYLYTIQINEQLDVAQKKNRQLEAKLSKIADLEERLKELETKYK